MEQAANNTTPDQLITIDNALTLDQIAEIASPRDHKLSRTTVYRWCKIGIGGVRLQYVKLGRRMLSSKRALNQFMQQLQEQDDFEWPDFDRKSATPRVRASAQHEDAKRILEEHGV